MEQVNLALRWAHKPVLVLHSAGVTISSTASTMYGGYKKLEARFVRDNEFVEPQETREGLALHVTTPIELCSDVEKDFELMQWTKGTAKTPPMLVAQRMSPTQSSQLLGAREKRTKSLPLRIVSASPFLAESGTGSCILLGKGYNAQVGGVYVQQDLDIPDIPLPDAVNLLVNGLFADFNFVTPSDFSRAVSQLIAPALKLGGFLGNVDFPATIAIADQSQSGKTHLMKIIATIYGERPYVVINKSQRGVGSLDESMASALRSGKLFILCDNVRGPFDSQLMESALRGSGQVPVRIPYFGEVIILADRVLIQLTSNQADLPTDLTNRSIIISLRKPAKNYKPRLPWGDDFLTYLEGDRGLYLGAIHSVVREWVRRGKPRTNDRRHDFRESCQSMDWIIRNICNLPPLLEGHRETQRHLSSKTWGWFRVTVLAVDRAKKLGVALSTSELVDIGASSSIRLPNMREDADDDALAKHAGRLLREIFSDEDEDVVFMDEYQVDRTLERDIRQGRENKKYTVTKRKNAPIMEAVDQSGKVVVEPEVETFEINNPPAPAEPARPEIPAAPYRYVTTVDQLEAVFADLAEPGAIGLDLETFFPDAKMTKMGKRHKVAVDIVVDRFLSRIRLLQLYRNGSEQVWLIDCLALGEEAVKRFGEIIAERTIVGHGICTFDLPWLWVHYGFRASKIIDTLTMSKLVTGGAPKTLISNDLGSVLENIDVHLSKDQGSSDWGIKELAPEQLLYASNDVFHLHKIVEAYEKYLNEDGLGEAWALEQELAPVIVDLSNRGMPFDAASTGPIREDVDRRLAEAERAALAWFGTPNLNIASPRQLIEAFHAKGVRLESVDEKSLAESDSEGASLVQAHRNIQNKEAKFIESLVCLTRHGRIHGIFDSMGAKTGRIICKKPNLQQIPKRGLSAGQFPIRTLFKASPGKKLIISDFSQMELVAIACLHEPIMLEALKNGVDLHVRTAQLVLGKDEVTKADRQLAKAVNFGLCYGQMPTGFQRYAKTKYGIDLSVEEAENLRNRFFQGYPGLKAWHEKARRDADTTVEARTIIGRRAWLGESWWARFSGLLNHQIQGSCSDVLKLALIELVRRLKEIAEIVLSVHDELVMEADAELAEEAQKELDEIMVTCFQMVFPGAPISTESRIADAWQEIMPKVSMATT